MSNYTLRLRFDEESINRLHSFENYEAALDPALLKAMDSGTSMLQAYATDFMWSHFRHPTGAMESSWETDVQSPYFATVGNTAPYAQRRNYGFSNRTDALGRYYAHDSGIGWAELTLVAQQYKVRDVFQAAIDYANQQLERGSV